MTLRQISGSIQGDRPKQCSKTQVGPRGQKSVAKLKSRAVAATVYKRQLILAIWKILGKHQVKFKGKAYGQFHGVLIKQTVYGDIK